MRVTQGCFSFLPDLTDEQISAQPGRTLTDLVNDQPGWLYEANGILHPRGSEYDVQYVFDGLPLTQNRSPAFAPSLDPEDVESMRVLTAGFPAEYGRKLGGVIEVTTEKNAPSGLHGDLNVEGGSFASVSGYEATSPTDFRVDEKLSVHLFGIEPCDGDMVNRQEDFVGSCAEFAQRGLATLLQSPRVIYCRAFVTEQHSPMQDATCYGYYNYPGSLDSVDMFEEQLVSLGTHRIVKKADGSLARADLVDAEKIGRAGHGMWADPRIKQQ